MIIANPMTATTMHGIKPERFKLTEFTISTAGTLSDPSITPIKNAIVTSSWFLSKKLRIFENPRIPIKAPITKTTISVMFN